MEAFHLDIEKRVGRNHHLGCLADHRGKPFLVAALYGREVRLEVGVVREPLELPDLVEIAAPAGADARRDGVRELRIALQQPAAVVDAVGLVVELFGLQFDEVGEEAFFDQVAVEGGDAVDGMAADDRQVGHAHLFLRSLLDKRHRAELVHVAGEAQLDALEESGVDLEDDLQVVGEDLLHEFHGPALEGLGEQRVVGVAAGLHHDLPCLVPGNVRLVDQMPHELRYGERGVRVVQLYRVILVKLEQVLMALVIPADDVVDRAAYQEILLDQAQLLASVDAVGGIKDFCDGLRPVLALDRLDVLAAVEHVDPEPLGGARRPESEDVRRAVARADDRDVVRDSLEHLPVHPHVLKPSIGELHLLHVPVEEDRDAVLRADHLPRRAVFEPVVGRLLLPSVLELLLEHAMLVAEPVAVTRQSHRGH